MSFKRGFAFLDEMMEGLPACGVPMGDLAVSWRGKEVYRKQVGYTDEAQTRPTSDRDLYWIYSVSKVTTCLSAMRLIEQGKLSLDDPVSKYLPSFGELTVLHKDGVIRPAEQVMTIRHLFTMTGGLDYDRDKAPLIALLHYHPKASTVEIADTFAKSPLHFEPGTRYLYSLCHDALGAVIEVASGRRFSRYLQEEVWGPLHMEDTGFVLSSEQEERVAACYEYHSGKLPSVLCADKHRQTSFPEQYESGGGGLFSSVSDQMKMLTTIAMGGVTSEGYRLLKPETIAMLQVNRLPESAFPDFAASHHYGYGFGFCGRAHENAVMSHAKSPVGEFGWSGAAGAYCLMDPENQVAIYFGTHVKTCKYLSMHIHDCIRDNVYEEIL